ncbi:hypothetical protein RHCRD62_20626 [Rhodococcus sp. RD6.2]|jgi:hypothetical protein|nr:hypothetical protein RHCRD62_20626 [Rhodococcus sp. RD6.2]
MGRAGTPAARYRVTEVAACEVASRLYTIGGCPSGLRGEPLTVLPAGDRWQPNEGTFVPVRPASALR